LNVQANIYFTFSGQAQELEPFLSDLVKVVVEHGFGVTEDNLNSLIVFKESERGHWENPGDFAKSLVQNAISVIIPIKEKEDESELPGD